MTSSPARSPAIRIRTVCLRLAGQHLDPDVVTAKTGLTPSDARPPASGHRDLDGTWFECDMPGRWSFATGNVIGPGASLDDHLRAIFGADAGAVSLWQHLAAECELHVYIVVTSDPDARPPSLDEVLALATPRLAAAVRALPGRTTVEGV